MAASSSANYDPTSSAPASPREDEAPDRAWTQASASASSSVVAIQNKEGLGSPPSSSSPMDKWEAPRWMASLSNDGKTILDVLSAVLKKAAWSPKDRNLSELQALRKLGRREDLDQVLDRCLRNEAVIKQLKDILRPSLKDLIKSSTATEKEFREKFAGKTQELSYGHLDHFFKGLESMVGRPDVSVLDAMFREHYECGDANTEFKKATCKGETTTWREFSIVLLGSDKAKSDLTRDKVKELEKKMKDFDPSQEPQEIEIADWTAEVRVAWSKLEKLLTQPSTASEGSEDSQGARRMPGDASKTIPIFEALENFAACRHKQDRKDQGLSQDDGKPVRVPLRHFRFEFWAMNQILKQIGANPLSVAELVAVRLYTGEMYQKYNSVLRMFTNDPERVKQWKELCQGKDGEGNKYCSTLHATNSGLIKISKVQKADKVFRGVMGGHLPDSFINPNALGVLGGIEFGFFSATLKRGVATDFAGQGGKKGQSGIVFEVQQGLIDRGASLGWISQYPSEKEVCFGPLCAMQVVDKRVEGNLLIVEVRLTVNMISQTIEQVTAKRRTLIEDMCRNLSREATETLGQLEDNWVEEKLCKKVKHAFRRFSQCDGNWYNQDKEFKACVGSAVDLREAVIWLQKVLNKDYQAIAPDQVYQKLIPLNWLSEENANFDKAIEAFPQSWRALEVKNLVADLEDEHRKSELIETFGTLRGDSLEVAKIWSRLRGAEEALLGNRHDSLEYRERAVEGCEEVAKVLTESYQEFQKTHRIPLWQPVARTFVRRLVRQIPGGKTNPSHGHPELRRAAIEASAKLLELGPALDVGDDTNNKSDSDSDSEQGEDGDRTSEGRFGKWCSHLIRWGLSLKDPEHQDVPENLRIATVQALRLAGRQADTHQATKTLEGLFASLGVGEEAGSSDPSEKVRMHILDTLRSFGADKALKADGLSLLLKAAKTDKNRNFQHQALRVFMAACLLVEETRSDATINEEWCEVLHEIAEEACQDPHDGSSWVGPAAIKAKVMLMVEAGGCKNCPIQYLVDLAKRKDLHWAVHRIVVICLGSCSTEADGRESQRVQVMLEVARQAVSATDEEGYHKIVASCALEALGDLGAEALGPDGMQFLQETAGNSDAHAWARLWALDALDAFGREGRTCSPQTAFFGPTDALRRAAEDKNVEIGCAAARTLCNLGVEVERYGKKLLAELKNTKDRNASWYAVRDLCQLRRTEALGEAGLKALKDFAASKECWSGMKSWVHMAFHNYGIEVEEHGQSLLKELRGKDNWAKRSTVEALGCARSTHQVLVDKTTVADAILSAAAEASDPSIRRAAVKSLENYKTEVVDPCVLDRLLEMSMRDSDGRVRTGAATAHTKLYMKAKRAQEDKAGAGPSQAKEEGAAAEAS